MNINFKAYSRFIDSAVIIVRIIALYTLFNANIFSYYKVYTVPHCSLGGSNPYTFKIFDYFVSPESAPIDSKRYPIAAFILLAVLLFTLFIALNASLKTFNNKYLTLSLNALEICALVFLHVISVILAEVQVYFRLGILAYCLVLVPSIISIISTIKGGKLQGESEKAVPNKALTAIKIISAFVLTVAVAVIVLLSSFSA